MFELEIRESFLSLLHSLFKLQEPGLTCTCISRLLNGEEWAYENNNPHPHAYTPVHLALNMIIVIEIMLIIIKKYLINLSKCDPVAVSGWFSCTTRSLDHFTCTPCCKIVHSCSTECRNKITGIIMKVVRSLHEVERLSSNPNYCVLDLCLPFKPNIQNIKILQAVLRMHSSGTHCTVIGSSLHRKQ